MDPNFNQARYRLGAAYAEKGMYEEAILEFTHLRKLPGGELTAMIGLAYTYALAGMRDEAQKNLDELLKLSKQRFVSPAHLAIIYVALGDKDKAFAWLEEADKAHDLQVVRLKVDPRFAPLRSDPRFDDLVRRIGIP